MKSIDPKIRLIQGNLRFVDETQRIGSISAEERSIASGDQKPFAVILSCSDSRVPPEIIFDQRLGDIFVIRVAGNVVSPTQVGSIEFAVKEFGASLVVVLGHSGCGAVKAALRSDQASRKNLSTGLSSIVNLILPSIDNLSEKGVGLNEAELLSTAIRENIHNSVKSIKSQSSGLNSMVLERKIVIVGAEYSLDTGLVTFLDDDLS